MENCGRLFKYISFPKVVKLIAGKSNDLNLSRKWVPPKQENHLSATLRKIMCQTVTSFFPIQSEYTRVYFLSLWSLFLNSKVLLFTTVQRYATTNDKNHHRENYIKVQWVKESNRGKLNSHIKTALQINIMKTFEFGLQILWIVKHWNSYSPCYRGRRMRS